MSEDRRTKAQLVAEIERLEEARREDKRRDVIVAAPERVPEADALASCIRALDRLDGGRDSWQKRGEVARVLRSLADKYKVEVFTTEVRTEPCDRAHLDTLGPAELGGYLMNVARNDERR